MRVKKRNLIFLTLLLFLSTFLNNLITPANANSGGSMSFAGTSNSYLTIANQADLRMGTGDFTIEWWQYQTDNNSWPRIFSMGNYPATIGVSIEGGTFYFWNGSALSFGSMGTYKNTWVHMAIVRQGTTLKVYKDGTQLGSSRTVSTNFSDTTNALVIGNEATKSTGAAFGGLITNFHWIKGTAKYTSNFTTPYPPISSQANSKILLLAATSGSVSADSSGTSKTVTNTNVTFSSSTPQVIATTLSTPATPTANPTSGTLKSIAVSWTAVTNASNYTLKLYASNGTTLLATITGLSGTSRTITASDYASLADGTTYQVSITAIGNGSTFLDSSESTKRTVTTSQTLSNASLSSATPTSATLKSINLSWSAVSNASNYTIKIYNSSNTLLQTLTNITGTSKTISTSDYSSLADSTTYKFSIQAIGNNTSYLSSSESSLVTATTHSPVTVSINRSLVNPYSSRNLRYTFTFSENITGFTTSNLSVSGTSTGWTLGSLSGSGSSYSITLTNSSPIDGTINLTLDNSGIAAVSSSVQPATTSASTFTLGKATQVTTWIKFLWGEDLQRF